MVRIYVSTKVIHGGSVELASLSKKEERKNIIVQFRKQTITFEGIYMHTGRESHVDSDGDS